MSRYISEFRMEQNRQQFFDNAFHTLTQMGYEYVDFEGEKVFKKGNGWVSAPTFFKLSYTESTVRIEAWMKTAILPYVYCGESGIDGFWGFAVKDVLKGRVRQLEQMIVSMGATPLGILTAQNTQPSAPPTVAPYQPQTQTVAQARRFCSECGSPVQENSAFCSNCGAPQK